MNATRWVDLAEGVDRDLLARRPQPGEWSALECLGHAADTEAAVFATRVRAFMVGQPRLATFDPRTQGTPIDDTTDAAALAAMQAALRVDSLALLATVTEADLERTTVHPDYGVITLRELLNEWAAHEIMHLVQAERALMQAFIPGSGPWRPFFADHDVAVDRRPT
jgi:hypothetical protein